MSTATSARWATIAAAVVVIIVTIAAFAVSFTVLSDLAGRSGIPGAVAWMWPVITDGTIVAAMMVILAVRGHSGVAAILPRLTLALFILVSVGGNAVHALLVPGEHAPAALAIAVCAVPPTGLALSVEMLVLLLQARREQAPAQTASVAMPAVSLAMASDVADEAATPVAAVPATVPGIVAPETPVATGIAAPVAAASFDETPVATGDRHGEPVAACGEETGEPVAAARMESPLVAAPSPVALATGETSVAISGEPLATDAAFAEADEEPVAVEPEDVAAPIAIHAVAPLPTTPADQINWAIERARTGQEITWGVIAGQFDLSDRQAQRRLTEARKRAPEAFEAAS